LDTNPAQECAGVIVWAITKNSSNTKPLKMMLSVAVFRGGKDGRFGLATI
jgi:hypothetical protein